MAYMKYDYDDDGIGPMLSVSCQLSTDDWIQWGGRRESCHNPDRGCISCRAVVRLLANGN